MYTSELLAYPDVLRAINTQGTDTGMVWVPPGIKVWPHPSLADVPTTPYVCRDGILLQSYEIHNAAADGTDVGIGFRLGPSHWRIGHLTADYATYTDLTSDAQARSAITIQTTGANQSGFVMLFDRRVHWVSLTITTAETNAGGSTVADHAVQYSNAAGTGWTVTTAGLTDNFTTTNTVWAAGLTQFVWKPPAIWGKTKGLGGLPDGWYALGFTSAHREASDVAAIATGVECGTLRIYENADQYTVMAAEKAEMAEFAADGIVAYFSAANAANAVQFTCRPIG